MFRAINNNSRELIRSICVLLSAENLCDEDPCTDERGHGSLDMLVLPARKHVRS